MAEHQRQIAANGEELQPVELVRRGRRPRAPAGRRRSARRDRTPCTWKCAGARLAADAACRRVSCTWNTVVPNTRRIGMAKLELVYCVRRRDQRIAAVPDGAAARRPRRKAMDEHCGQHARADEEDQDDQAIVGAAALGDRHDRQPGRGRPAAACARRSMPLHHRRQQVDDEAGQHAGEKAKRREHEHGGEREAIDLVRLLRRPPCAGARET